MKPEDARVSTAHQVPRGEYVQKSKEELFHPSQPQSTSATSEAFSYSQVVTVTTITAPRLDTVKIEFDVAEAERRANLAKLNARLDRDRSR
jgi:hypothetical protein